MKSFWKDKCVLITGGSGFVGAHLARRLLRSHAHVYTVSSHAHPKEHPRHTPVLADIADMRRMRKVFEEVRPQICFHLGAKSHVESGNNDPLPLFYSNIQGSWNIFELCRIYSLKAVIAASTAHIYGDHPVPFLEEYLPKPTRPYETSKSAADLIGQMYVSHYGLPLSLARFTNIYGPGDTSYRLIPATIQKILHNELPIVFPERTVRDFIFINDAIEAYLLLAEYTFALSDKTNREYLFNFGSGELTDNREIINKLIRISQKKLHPLESSTLRKNDIERQYVSIAKALRLLSWRPRTQIDAGLTITYESYIQTAQST